MRVVLFGLLTALPLANVADAHFLWLVANPDGKPGEVHAYFSESASPDDPDLLKKFAGLQVVAVTQGRGESKRHHVELTPGDESLHGKLPERLQAPLVAAKTYGVVSRGGETFLLKYYAKAYPSPLPGSWTAQGDTELAALEITPSVEGDMLVLRVAWKGESAVGDQVTVDGDALPEKIQGETSADGEFRCKLPAKGLYSIRARHVEQGAGEFENQTYASIRHYATLSLPYAPPKVVAVGQTLPELPRGITSLGAAVVNDELYVYGGHFGAAHHYSEEGQSNEFRRLSLTKADATWETLPAGPRLTGAALEAFGGKLYRLGGFTAKNKEADDQELWSQDGFAMFDPATGRWTDLPALPEPRSSHDADVMDSKLYVAGGWTMAGPENTTWLSTAWVCDLTEPDRKWTALPEPPFRRRAVSVTGYRGQLYVLGGMQESGGPTTRVDVLDLATGTWSEGPPLIGSGMEGFGNASFVVGDRLIATTISGSIQQLNAAGSGWEIIGQVHHPRFFHRQLATPRGEFVLVGGASMATGKTTELEVFAVK